MPNIIKITFVGETHYDGRCDFVIPLYQFTPIGIAHKYRVAEATKDLEFIAIVR